MTTLFVSILIALLAILYLNAKRRDVNDREAPTNSDSRGRLDDSPEAISQAQPRPERYDNRGDSESEPTVGRNTVFQAILKTFLILCVVGVAATSIIKMVKKIPTKSNGENQYEEPVKKATGESVSRILGR